MPSSFRLYAAELQRGMAALDPRVRAALGAAMDRSGQQAVAYMKANAPWTDRTTAARGGLSHRLERAGDGWGLILFGRVAYQIYLETKQSGKYAIITPTIQMWGPKVMQLTDRLLDRLGAGR